MTLNQMIDDLLQTCEKIDADKTLTIERSQVILWIRAYRLIVLRQDINSNSIIDPSYISTLDMPFHRVRNDLDLGIEGRSDYRSNIPVPELPVLTGRFAVLSLEIVYSPLLPGGPLNNPGGIIVPLFDKSSVLYMQHSRYEPVSFAGYMEEKYMWIAAYIRGKLSGELPMNIGAECRAILCNPDDAKPDDEQTLSYMDRPYPLPEWKWPRVKQMILSRELAWLYPPQVAAQGAQEMKLEEKENENNPAVMMQEGADLYEAQ